MSHGRSHSRFHRFLAKKHKSLLKKFRDADYIKDELLHKFKQRKHELIGT